MIRRMLSFYRPPGEDMATFMERTNGIIKNLMQLHQIERWDLTARRYIFKWGSWLARLEQLDPERLTGWFFIFKDWCWIQKITRDNQGRQLHCRKLRTWRWERPFYKILGEHWPAIARDKEKWDEMQTELVHKRSMVR